MDDDGDPVAGWAEYSRLAREIADLRRAELERERHLANLQAAMMAERARLTANLRVSLRRETF